MSNQEKPESVFEALSKGKKPVVEGSGPGETQTPVAIAGLGNETNLNLLLQLLLAKEGREIATAQQAEERRKAIQKQRDRNAKDQDSKLLLKQARCKHLKGGKKGPKTQNKDYAVYQHRFIAMNQYIRCRICGMKWFPQDTAEYLFRNNKKISNHTHIGWREAVNMTDASTDTMSASEGLTVVSPNAASYVDAAGLPVRPRVTDLEGNEVTDVEL